jgi:hypothetical protein
MDKLTQYIVVFMKRNMNRANTGKKKVFSDIYPIIEYCYDPRQYN